MAWPCFQLFLLARVYRVNSKAAAATVAYIPTQLACFITLLFSSEGEHESKIKQQHLEICYQHKYLFLSNNKVFILHNGYETTGTQGDAD